MIYYVAYYNPIEEKNRRTPNFAAEDKIDYICDTINDIGEKVTILSNSKSLVRKFLQTTQYIESDNKKIIMFASLPKLNIFLHIINVLFGYLQLSWYLVKNVNYNDTVIVYHSLGYRNLIKNIKIIKRFRYILEVEELYKHINDNKSSFKNKEHKVFKYPDAYIFSNSELDNVVNKYHKPSVVVNGVYRVNTTKLKKLNNKSIRIVYAGSLEKQKGVDYVIKSCKYLNENYDMRIIGFGSESDIGRVKSLISEVKNSSKCKIQYDGLFKGEDYISYLQKFDIGICIQDPNDEFNKYEFPSKILSYMSNGLSVVVNKLEQVENSDLYAYLTISEGIDAYKISEAIKRVDMIENSNVDILKGLDEQFKLKLYKLIKGELWDANE
ncbi:glycosyltransferase [Anaerococcus tetradius]|uniref:glycosyltransferase n=1 Tax=Anaerococcus tetradius TaxID=33036 RepID=UPI0023F3894C|nr:glycosyltransferase [Anaerococcus tetradius]